MVHWLDEGGLVCVCVWVWCTSFGVEPWLRSLEFWLFIVMLDGYLLTLCTLHSFPHLTFISHLLYFCFSFSFSTLSLTYFYIYLSFIPNLFHPLLEHSLHIYLYHADIILHSLSLPATRIPPLWSMDVELEANGSDLGSGCLDCWNASGWDYWDDWSPSPSLFSDTELVVVTTLCIPLLLLGLAGNALTILVVWRCPQMRSTTYLYLSSMAVSDIVILLLMPLDLYKVGVMRNGLTVVACQGIYNTHGEWACHRSLQW